MRKAGLVESFGKTLATVFDSFCRLAGGHNNSWYAPGSVGGNHFLFVDHTGKSLEISINSENLLHTYHTNDSVYASNYVNRPAFDALRAAPEVDFEMFHNVSRQSPILNGISIAGMTVEVDPDYPELLTCAWLALPAEYLTYPVFMGQNAIPMPLADGSGYTMGKNAAYDPSLWQAMERTMHAEKELIRQVVADNIVAGTPIPEVDKVLEDWSRTQATAVVGQSTGFTRDYYSSEPAGIQITGTQYTIDSQEFDAAFGGFFYSTSSGRTLAKTGSCKFTLIGDHDYTRRSPSDLPFSLRVQNGLYKVIGGMNIEEGNFALAGGRVEAQSMDSAGQTWDVTLVADYEVAGQSTLVNVTGTADITNTTLNLTMLVDGYSPTQGFQFMLLTADSIVGASAGGQMFGHADGDVWSIDDVTFRIDYVDGVAGDGIRLTVLPEPSTLTLLIGAIAALAMGRMITTGKKARGTSS